VQFGTWPSLPEGPYALRPLREDDIPRWFAYLSRHDVHEHTSWDLRSEADLVGYVWGAELVTPASRLRLAIARRDDDVLVGTAGFHTVRPEHLSAEIAYDLSPAVWGRGVASAACLALTRWAHATVGLRRVQPTVLVSNERSIRVLERCGYRREGCLAAYRWVRGRPGDFYVYADVA
jgi:ribosomal-protein-alanine N-acetyltransferase